MKQSRFARWLREAFRAALDTTPDGGSNEGGTKVQLAMLIDMENTAPAQMGEIMSRAQEYGEVTHRLAFGPTSEAKWAKARLAHAIRWGRQSLVKTGKNSADIELVIAAMDLVQNPSIRGFCIVSSDSDFTPLAMRLREAGKLVVGFGEKKAPAGFVEACDRFEILGAGQAASTTGETRSSARNAKASNSASASAKQHARPQPKAKAPIESKGRKEFLDLLRRAAAKAKDHDGWIYISAIGGQVRKIKPDIRYKDYGHKTLIGILETYPEAIKTRGKKEQKQMRLRT